METLRQVSGFLPAKEFDTWKSFGFYILCKTPHWWFVRRLDKHFLFDVRFPISEREIPCTKMQWVLHKDGNWINKNAFVFCFLFFVFNFFLFFFLIYFFFFLWKKHYKNNTIHLNIWKYAPFFIRAATNNPFLLSLRWILFTKRVSFSVTLNSCCLL